MCCDYHLINVVIICAFIFVDVVAYFPVAVVLIIIFFLMFCCSFVLVVYTFNIYYAVDVLSDVDDEKRFNFYMLFIVIVNVLWSP